MTLNFFVNKSSMFWLYWLKKTAGNFNQSIQQIKCKKQQLLKFLENCNYWKQNMKHTLKKKEIN